MKAKKTVKAVEVDVVESPKYVTASTEKVKRGFLLELVEWVKKKPSGATVEQMIAEFSGRQIEGRKVDADRCRRYVVYCKAKGIFKIPK